ncbi:MAG: tetratricopeptide repeat protein [Spirochaetales bacterium]|nr:tetratricopeptide repeat protein [Spirochaetales bacterium]
MSGRSILAGLALSLFLGACVSDPAARPGSALGGDRAAAQAGSERAAIELHLVNGTPASLEAAMDLAEAGEDLSKADAHVYAWLAYELARLAYPELMPPLTGGSDAPPDAPAVKAFVDARNGRQSESVAGGILTDFMPMLSVFRVKTSTVATQALAAFERFSRLGVESALAEYMRGLSLERTGDTQGALESYRRSLAYGPDCYPAALNASRLLASSGQAAEGQGLLEGVQPAVKASLTYRKAWAHTQYGLGKWEDALTLITAVLLDDPMDSSFLLMRAHILVEQGDYKLASPLLDAYAGVDPNNRLYLLLRARVAFENAKDRAGALTALRKGLERYPGDPELGIYAAELLAAGDDAERSEAIQLAGSVLERDTDNLKALAVLLDADLRAGNAASAAERADRIWSLDKTYANLDALYRAYRLAGRSDDAKTVAQAWRQREPTSEAAALAWAGILIEEGSKTEAAAFINGLLAGKGSSSFRSTLYYLQAKLQANADAALAMLRSALIENGLNVDALVAMTEIYTSKGDYQRARFYLKQAMALAPARADVVERQNVLTQLGVALP